MVIVEGISESIKEEHSPKQIEDLVISTEEALKKVPMGSRYIVSFGLEDKEIMNKYLDSIKLVEGINLKGVDPISIYDSSKRRLMIKGYSVVMKPNRNGNNHKANGGCLHV